ncbi:MAG: hypothetical protein M1499_00005, partial [Firmicutes bacterium]|nr:hypothetical protein [Bacillota bacterium]
LSGLIHRYYHISEIRHVIANTFALGHCAQNFFADENTSPRMIILDKLALKPPKTYVTEKDYTLLPKLIISISCSYPAR